MMEERRKFVRLDTRLEVTYTVLPSGSAQHTVSKGIGGGGLCFFSDQPLAAGTCLQMAMKLPGREQPVHFTAEVVWSEPYEVIGKTERQRAVEVGVRFLEVAPKDLEAVTQRITLSFKSSRPNAG